MTNIFQAFKDHDRKAAGEARELNHAPLFAPTPEERRASMARIKARWPDLFDRAKPMPPDPHAELAAKALASQTTPITPSEWFARRYRRRLALPPPDDDTASQGS